jgi:hypothetical protein
MVSQEKHRNVPAGTHVGPLLLFGTAAVIGALTAGAGEVAEAFAVRGFVALSAMLMLWSKVKAFGRRE